MKLFSAIVLLMADIAITTSTDGDCNLLPGPKAGQYYEPLGGSETLLRSCAPGTGFDKLTCDCSVFLPYEIPAYTCRPALYLPFDHDLSDQSPSHVYVGNSGVKILKNVPGAIGEGVAYFDGFSSAIIPAFANDDLGDKLVITFRYQEVDVPGATFKSEDLISNSGCKSPCSVAVTFNRAASETAGKIRTVLNGTKIGTVKNNMSKKASWKQVQYTYNGEHLIVVVDREVTDVQVAGRVEMLDVKAAIQLGVGCKEYNRFTGYMDELYIYKCLV